MNKFLEFAQLFVLKTNRFWPLNKLYVGFYIFAVRVIIYTFKKIPVISSIYVKGGTRRTLGIPGSSDIDLIFITKSLDPEHEFFILQKIYRYFRVLNRIFPFFSHYKTLSISEAEVYSQLKVLTGSQLFSGKSQCVYGQAIPENKKEEKLEDSDFLNRSIDALRHFNRDIFNLNDNGHLRHYTKRLKVILDCLRPIGELSSSQHFQDLEKKIALIKKTNYFVSDYKDTLLDLWVKAMFLVDDACVQAKLAVKPQDRGISFCRENKYNFTFTKYNFVQETQQHVFQIVKSFIKEAGFSSNEIKGILLGPENNTNYQYNIVPIFSKDLEVDIIKDSLHRLAVGYRKIKFRKQDWYFSLPLAMMENTSRFFIDNMVYPLGSASFLRHGKILFDQGVEINKNLKEVIDYINTIDFSKLIALLFLGPPLGVNITENLIQSITFRDLKTLSFNLDAIFGLIPAKRLLLEKRIITTSPLETYREYLDHFKLEPTSQFYRYAYSRFYLDINRKNIFSDLEEKMPDIHKFIRVNTDSIISAIKSKWLKR